MYWEFSVCRNLLCGFLVIEVFVVSVICVEELVAAAAATALAVAVAVEVVVIIVYCIGYIILL